MFIQHKQLKNLNVAVEKIASLHSASSGVQLAFSGFPPQTCQAYLMRIVGGQKVLIVVAFYLTESCCSIFFVPRHGEVSIADAEKVYDEGYSFIESMGFILNETDFHLLSEDKKKSYWQALPIAKPSKLADSTDDRSRDLQVAQRKKLQHLSAVSSESLGRFLASM